MRLINADVLMEDLKQSHDRLLNIYEGLLFENEKRVCSAEIATYNEIGLRIKAAPTIDAEPVRHGRWIRMDDTHTRWKCSECGGVAESPLFRHCHCGAKMDGGDPYD